MCHAPGSHWEGDSAESSWEKVIRVEIGAWLKKEELPKVIS